MTSTCSAAADCLSRINSSAFLNADLSRCSEERGVGALTICATLFSDVMVAADLDFSVGLNEFGCEIFSSTAATESAVTCAGLFVNVTTSLARTDALTMALDSETVGLATVGLATIGLATIDLATSDSARARPSLDSLVSASCTVIGLSAALMIFSALLRCSTASVLAVLILRQTPVAIARNTKPLASQSRGLKYLFFVAFFSPAIQSILISLLVCSPRRFSRSFSISLTILTRLLREAQAITPPQ